MGQVTQGGKNDNNRQYAKVFLYGGRNERP